jgi:hypothetical protein
MKAMYCTQTLWRVLGPNHRRRKAAPSPSGTAPTALSAWAATHVRNDRKNLILALNQATYLTVVFPLIPRERWRGAFAAALVAILEDLQIPEPTIEREIASVASLALAQLKSRPMRDALAYAKYICEIEFFYLDDLRRVQRNLNALPHGGIGGHLPSDAATRLLLQSPIRSKNHVH